jgi:hypothetical protein
LRREDPEGKVGFVEPMLAVAVKKLPEGAPWSHELNFDGYRALGVKSAGNGECELPWRLSKYEPPLGGQGVDKLDRTPAADHNSDATIQLHISYQLY